MITLNRTDLLTSLKEACERKNTRMNILAEELHVQKNTLSGWFGYQYSEVPFNNLVKLSRILNDEEFIESVKHYMFGYSDKLNQITDKSVAAIYLRQKKEEHDRLALTPDLEEVLSINDTEINNKEIRNKALHVFKEFHEEIGIEQELKIRFKTKFDFTEQELKKVGLISE